MSKKKIKVLWLTSEPSEYYGGIARNAGQAGIDLWIFNSMEAGLRILAEKGCRRPNGFRAVVFDLTVEYPVKLCRTLRRRYPRLHRVCFTQFCKDAERQLPHLTTKFARHTLIRKWIQSNDWVEGDWNGGRHAQLTNILKSIDI